MIGVTSSSGEPGDGNGADDVGLDVGGGGYCEGGLVSKLVADLGTDTDALLLFLHNFLIPLTLINVVRLPPLAFETSSVIESAENRLACRSRTPSFCVDVLGSLTGTSGLCADEYRLNGSGDRGMTPGELGGRGDRRGGYRAS
jgi:hypothetical protein